MRLAGALDVRGEVLRRIAPSAIQSVQALLDEGLSGLAAEELKRRAFQVPPMHVFQSVASALGTDASKEGESTRVNGYLTFHGYVRVEYWRDATGTKWTVATDGTQWFKMHPSSSQ